MENSCRKDVDERQPGDRRPVDPFWCFTCKISWGTQERFDHHKCYVSCPLCPYTWPILDFAEHFARDHNPTKNVGDHQNKEADPN